MAIGPEEYLLAILHPEAGDPIAARALHDCGVGREALTELVKPKQSPEVVEGGPQLNPAAYQLMSLAEGIAAGLGAPEVTLEHVLLAFLWDPRSDAQFELLGSSRARVRGRLAKLGIDVPQAELPPPTLAGGARGSTSRWKTCGSCCASSTTSCRRAPS